MSENTPQVPSQADETSPLKSKEIRQLLWIGIISVWLVMVLILYTGSTNYQSAKNVERMSKSQKSSALSDEVAQIRSGLSANTAKMSELNGSVQKLIGEQKAIKNATTREIRDQLSSSVQKLLGNQEKIRAGLSANTAKQIKSLEKLVGEQKAITEEIRAELSSNVTKVSESVGKLLGEQKTAISEDVRTQLASNASAFSKSVQKLLGEQKAIIKGIKDDNLRSAEGMQLLKKFVENQNSLLGQITGGAQK